MLSVDKEVTHKVTSTPHFMMTGQSPNRPPEAPGDCERVYLSYVERFPHDSHNRRTYNDLARYADHGYNGEWAGSH